MDPTTLKLASDFLGGAGKGLTSAAPAQSGIGQSPFDASGWIVNFGAGNIEATRQQPTASSGGDLLPIALVGVALVVAWRLTRK